MVCGFLAAFSDTLLHLNGILMHSFLYRHGLAQRHTQSRERMHTNTRTRKHDCNTSLYRGSAALDVVTSATRVRYLFVIICQRGFHGRSRKVQGGKTI